MPQTVLILLNPLHSVDERNLFFLSGCAVEMHNTLFQRHCCIVCMSHCRSLSVEGKLNQLSVI